MLTELNLSNFDAVIDKYIGLSFKGRFCNVTISLCSIACIVVTACRSILCLF